jgi:signal transduction histidine kinase
MRSLGNGLVEGLMERLRRLTQRLSEELERQRAELPERIALLEETQAALTGLLGVMQDAHSGQTEEPHERLLELQGLLSRLRTKCLEGEQERLERLSDAVGELNEDLSRAAGLAALGEISTSVAHEIRNPLCGMLLSLEVLKTKMDANDSRMRLLDNVHREAEKMEKIVENLLHFARKYRPQLVHWELEDVVRKSLESVHQHLEKNEIAVDIQRRCAKCEADVDPDLVQQVFRNVLLNSIDACPKGSRIEIYLSELAADDAVGVAFRDEGEGMSREQLARIFEPFYTSRHKGIGLGLAVSKKIVDAHNGRIDVQSAPGKGATFTIIFPRTAAKVAA